MRDPKDTTQNRPPFGQRPGGGRGPMGHGPMGGMGMPGEKARNFKGTMVTLLKYLKPYRISLIIALVLAISRHGFYYYRTQAAG